MRGRCVSYTEEFLKLAGDFNSFSCVWGKKEGRQIGQTGARRRRLLCGEDAVPALKETVL